MLPAPQAAPFKLVSQPQTVQVSSQPTFLGGLVLMSGTPAAPRDGTGTGPLVGNSSSATSVGPQGPSEAADGCCAPGTPEHGRTRSPLSLPPVPTGTPLLSVIPEVHCVPWCWCRLVLGTWPWQCPAGDTATVTSPHLHPSQCPALRGWVLRGSTWHGSARRVAGGPHGTEPSTVLAALPSRPAPGCLASFPRHPPALIVFPGVGRQVGTHVLHPPQHRAPGPRSCLVSLRSCPASSAFFPPHPSSPWHGDRSCCLPSRSGPGVEERWREAKVCFDMLAPPAPREGWGGSGAAGPPRQSPSEPSWGPQATAPIPRLSLHRWLPPCQRCGARCPRAQLQLVALAVTRGMWDVPVAPCHHRQGLPKCPLTAVAPRGPQALGTARPWRCLPPPPAQASSPEHGTAPGMEGGRRGGRGMAAAAGAACLHAWGSLPVSLRCLESRRRRGSKY